MIGVDEFPGITQAFGSIEQSTGTTLVACEYDGGVMLGADSRTSMGSLVSNRTADKLTPVTDRVYCCRSGSAADTQAVTKAVRYNLDMYNIMMGETAPVGTVAYMFKSICYDYRDSLSAGLIVAGWDKYKGPQVYSIPIGGMCVRQPFATGGSGSTYIFGFLKSNYKKGMSKEQCAEFLTEAVKLAIDSDAHSGGVCRLAAIHKDGVEREVVSYNDLPQFHRY